MADNTHGSKRISINAETINIVLQRYSPNTILALLKEIAQDADIEKMDWKELVRKSSTGITNAREYQMIWRYLAYGTPLEETVDDDAEPLDDDSDIECELEVMPRVAPEVSAEAAACVKVLIDSDLPSKSSIPKGLETVTPAATTIEQLDGSNCSNLPPRCEIRQRWSEAEDKELVAAVQRYGEGNWTYISRVDFRSKRTASQIYKRWNHIKKHKGVLCLVPSRSQLSATRQALSLALDMPITKELKASSFNAGMSSATIPNFIQPTATEGKGSMMLGLSSPVNLKVQSESPDEQLRSTAFAMGARIGTSDDAASLLKAAQGNNVHYIRTGLPTPNSAYCQSTGKQENRPPVNGPETQIKDNLVGENSLQLNDENDQGHEDFDVD